MGERVSRPLAASSVPASRLLYLHNPRASWSPWPSLLPLIKPARAALGAAAFNAALAHGEETQPWPALQGWALVRLQHRARPLAEPFEAEIVAWVGRVSVWGSFFSYCQEFPLPVAFIFPRNSLQLKEKRKSKQKTPSLNRETFSVSP